MTYYNIMLHRYDERAPFLGRISKLTRAQCSDMFSDFSSISGRPRCRHQICHVAQYNLDLFSAPDVDFEVTLT